MNRAICLFVLFVLSIFGSAHCFIYQMNVLRREGSGGQHQYLLGLSDYHDKHHPDTNAQRNQLRQLLTDCKDCDGYVIVEDLSAANSSTGCKGCGQFLINSRGGILGGLSNMCQEMGVPVNNAEYRFCRVAAFGPILNRTFLRQGTRRSSAMITVDAIRNEILQQVNRIKMFDIDASLKSLYAKHLEKIVFTVQEFHLNKHPNMDAEQYLIAHTRPLTRDRALKKLLTFDNLLIDLDIVHTVLQARDKNVILIVAGGAHIKNSFALLERVGYKQMYKSSNSYTKEFNLERCLGSPIVGGKYCVKPEAVDLKAAGQFFKR